MDEDIKNVLEKIKKTISSRKALIQEQGRKMDLTKPEKDVKQGELNGLFYATDCIDEFLKEKKG